MAAPDAEDRQRLASQDEQIELAHVTNAAVDRRITAALDAALRDSERGVRPDAAKLAIIDEQITERLGALADHLRTDLNGMALAIRVDAKGESMAGGMSRLALSLDSAATAAEALAAFVRLRDECRRRGWLQP